MKNGRHIAKSSRALPAAALVVCVGVGAFALANLGGEAFDPSAFLESEFNRQSQPDYDAAFDVDRTEEDGEANLQADQSREEKPEQQPDIQEVDASSFARTEGSGGSVLSVVDTPAAGGGTIAGGQQGEGGTSGDAQVSGPVVNGEGQGNGEGEGQGGNGGGEPGGPDGPDGEEPGPDGPNTPDVPTPPVDPDPRPTLPDDVYEDNIIQTHPFPEEGVEPTPDAQGNVNITFLALTDDDLMSPDDPERLGMERIYHGMVLDEWKLLCSTFFYVSVNKTTYRVQNYSENFKVGAFPAVVEGDSLEVDYFFRFNDRYPWEKHTVKYRVHPCKVLMQGWDEGSYVKARYPDAGTSVDLSDLYGEMLPDDVTSDPFASPRLDAVFPGWSETEGGDALGASYTPTTKGRIVLYPLPMQPVPPEFEVVYSWGQQSLTGYTGSGAVCALPDGVQSVDTFDTIFADVIRLPASLQYGAMQLQARLSYEVAEGNTTYHVQDGMLFENEYNALMGIPTQMESVVVPEDTSFVLVPADNSIKRLDLTSLAAGVDPRNFIDVQMLHDAEIVVSADRFTEFLAVWGPAPGDGTNRLVSDSGESPDLIVRDGAVLSSDGTTLHQVLSSEVGTFFVPEGVVTVKSGAFADSALIDTVVLPQSVAKLEQGSLAGDSLKRVLFEGATPPVADVEAFGAAKAHVRPDAHAAYRDAWSASMGAATVDDVLVIDDFSTPEIDGYRLLCIALKDEGGVSLPGGEEAIVLSAPADVASFDADSIEGVDVTAVGPAAFKGCTNLTRVELPTSVKSIGQQAFADCSSLEVFFSASPDAIFIGAGAFDECVAVRLALFSAQSAEVADWSSLFWGGFQAYAPHGSTGYEDASPSPYQQVFDRDYDNLSLVSQSGGLVLYGTEAEGARRCVLKASSDIAGEVVLEQGTQVIVGGAFSDCANPFSLDAASMSAVEEVGRAAFERSGLTSVVLPAGCGTLGGAVFSGCALLESVVFETGPDGSSALEQVPAYAFSQCPKLTKLAFPSSVEEVGYGVISDAGVSTLAFSSEVPPRLIVPSPGVGYLFSESLPDGFKIALADDALVDSYIEAWKYALVGYAAGDELPPEEELRGTNLARALFGLPPLEELAAEPPVGENEQVDQV